MERDERDRADALDRYWDVIQRGDRPSATVAIEDELAALVAGLHAARVVAPVLFPDPEQAWRQLRQTPTPSPRPRRDAAAIPAPAHPNGRAAFAVEDRPAAAR